ncbi:O-antigen polymerase [Dyadobacter sp. CY347]|uniref:O-antigen polymerase n=1 Tax=Dyadobacter sp. CY347 TaxID=2909336 RepID=UPI001F321928|nr:O-antigen polymerase [Dyadobacter sp. CY347]MCF2491099.1 oligosaccharide repeat unit polymerase [Dyadobacter sp. CY347]
MYALFMALYLILFYKSYWGIFDRMFFSVINEVGGAFCVWLLWYRQSLKPEFGWSFIFTDLALVTGLIIARQIPIVKLESAKVGDVRQRVDGISEFDTFLFVVSVGYVIVEMLSMATIGFVLLNRAENHASAFSEHGILRAFVSSFRFLLIMVLFYKKVVLNRNWSLMDIFCSVFLLIGVLTSGAKAAILSFVFIYFMVSYPLIHSNQIKKIKISPMLALVLGSFPILVLMISVRTNAVTALQQVYVRLLASGDIFLLGYYDDVMNYIKETSFFRYAFYPGWGSVLKNLGFTIQAPRPLGAYIFEYYTKATMGGGPNARHNYLGLYFFGFYGSILYSFIIGLIIGYVRNSFKSVNALKSSYFIYFFFLILAYYMPYMIDDLNLFANSIFWTNLFFCLSFVVAKIIHSVMKAIVYAKSPARYQMD